MKAFHRIAVSSVIVAVMALSGCIVARDQGSDHGSDHGSYSYDHGDRIDSSGHREAHWCDAHHDDEHCRP